ncbi:PAS domain S-box protein [Devosia oryziradicis]|uniref:histidine kinase n=1 Tax=Devosia oryziradicis TaxID=2801335 RepID=A0ABX7BXB8_9HYPH|nr:PAS domain-containing sensor histidine kinase [Devosia oryziradicis]QQR36133.1 PAS domain S-box protein [Devosia oryziradicis]
MLDPSDHFQTIDASEERYRLLVESISDYAIYMMDSAGTVMTWNAGAQRFKGYSADEIVGQNFARFYRPEDQHADIPRRNLRVAAAEGRFEDAGWRVRKDGSQFWAHVVIDRIVDASGRVIGFAKITRDITERKQLEDALRTSEQQFRLLVKGVTDYALYMLDPQGNVASWNAGAQRIKGYEEAEIIGQHFSCFYTEEERRAGEAEYNLDIVRQKGSVEREGWRVRKDGSQFWAHVVIDAIRDEHGELLGFAKVTRDITERREAQLQLDQARNALFQSQKMEAIGQLTGGVAHDFNNLLMAILGSLEIVSQRMPHDPRISPFLENAVKGAQRGAALTQRMLAFARRQELESGPVDIAETVSSMRGIFDRVLGPSVLVRSQIPSGLPAALTDRAQLESALLNLAVNARDAMPAGGSITVSAEERAVPTDAGGLKPGRYIVLSIRDEGEGMDEQTLARATEPFFTTKGVGKGTGLGLSMVHGLAEQTGGRFVLDSKPGEGTTAELWLPVAGDDAAPAPVTEEAGPPAFEPKRILVVDDDALVLLNTATMAEDLGHQVLEATSGKEALAKLRSHPVDLVITDYAMPQMNGGQLASAIETEWPHIKVIVATGYSEMPEELRGKFERLGKPFWSHDLKAAIERTFS